MFRVALGVSRPAAEARSGSIAYAPALVQQTAGKRSDDYGSTLSGYPRGADLLGSRDDYARDRFGIAIDFFEVCCGERWFSLKGNAAGENEPGRPPSFSSIRHLPPSPCTLAASGRKRQYTHFEWTAHMAYGVASQFPRHLLCSAVDVLIAEPFYVEALVAKPAVEALVGAVLPGLARSDVSCVDSCVEQLPHETAVETNSGPLSDRR